MNKSDIIKLAKVLMVSIFTFFILIALIFLSLYFLLAATLEDLGLTFSVSFTTMLIIVIIISWAIVVNKLKSYSNKMSINESGFSKGSYNISTFAVTIISVISIGLMSINYIDIYNAKQREKKELEMFRNFAKYNSIKDTISKSDVKILIDSLNSIDK